MCVCVCGGGGGGGGGGSAWHDENDAEFLNDSLSKYLHQRCMVGNVGHLWSVGEVRCGLAMIS